MSTFNVPDKAKEEKPPAQKSNSKNIDDSSASSSSSTTMTEKNHDIEECQEKRVIPQILSQCHNTGNFSCLCLLVPGVSVFFVMRAIFFAPRTHVHTRFTRAMAHENRAHTRTSFLARPLQSMQSMPDMQLGWAGLESSILVRRRRMLEQ